MSLSLEHYGLSPVTGFLPSKPPLQRLPDAYFAPWENRLDGLHEALADHSIRKDIQKLPLLDTTRLQTTEEYQRAFLVLCFLSHAYVWGEEEAAKGIEFRPSNFGEVLYMESIKLSRCNVNIE
ncbi:hypothetical protein G6F48_000136 [Rhizopus delemar]|nr:hypothetical protein G6F48_000136 [Rhizopus delemar]